VRYDEARAAANIKGPALLPFFITAVNPAPHDIDKPQELGAIVPKWTFAQACFDWPYAPDHILLVKS